MTSFVRRIAALVRSARRAPGRLALPDVPTRREDGELEARTDARISRGRALEAAARAIFASTLAAVEPRPPLTQFEKRCAAALCAEAPA